MTAGRTAARAAMRAASLRSVVVGALVGALLVALSLPGARAATAPTAGARWADGSPLDELVTEDPPGTDDAPTSSGDPASTTAAAAQSGDAHVEVVDDEFDPEDLEVAAEPGGTATVVWEQTGDNPHTVTADDGSFDSHEGCPPDFTSCMSNGDTYEQELAPGTYPYHCKIHGAPGGEGMAGVVVVSESGDVTTTSAPDDEGTDESPSEALGSPEDASAGEAAGDTAGDTAAVEPAASDDALPATGAPGVLGVAGLLALAGAATLRLLGLSTRESSW